MWGLPRTGLVLTLLAAASLGACSEGSTTASSDAGASSATQRSAQAPGGAGTQHAGKPRMQRARPHPRTPRAPGSRHPAGLPVSSASATIVQPQPPPGSCHARGSGSSTRPDPACTPGALNPAVTQATIRSTICVSGYTSRIRPPESITAEEKRASMAAYGDSRPPDSYEYDHLVALELGGAANDPRNLWPEPGGSPNPKDAVENELHRMVCDGEMRLAAAQRIIATGWVAWATQHGGGGAPPTPPRSAPTPTSTAAAPPSGGGPNKPISEINCSDFPTHTAAQQWFVKHGGSPSNDVAGLDHDHDGLACESLP
jgi:hypothetical protein